MDYFQEKFGERPSVRLTNADLSLNLHIAGHTCTLSLDSSGESLHKRGYRVEQTEAPLNEVLAAGMILKTGWNGQKNFMDPMCGSGTLLIEAALIATNTPPGIYRQGFAFEKWKDYDEDLFDSIYNDETNEREFEFKIYGSDISPRAISIAEANIKSAGMSRYVTLSTKPFQQYINVPANTTMVVNPPYGERISSKDILNLYEMIGSTLKHKFKGYDAWVLSYKEECFDKIGLKPSEKIALMNGGLDCEFRKYEIFDGKLKSFKAEGGEFVKEEKFEVEETDAKLKNKLRKERSFDNKGERRAPRRDSHSSDRRSSGPARRENSFKREGDRKPFDSERGERSFRREGDRERKPYGSDRGDRFKREGDRERKPYGSDRRDDRFKREGDSERKPFRRGTESGNFVRNAEGKLELREGMGESKPRGERVFNPDRPMFYRDTEGKTQIINSKTSEDKKNED